MLFFKIPRSPKSNREKVVPTIRSGVRKADFFASLLWWRTFLIRKILYIQRKSHLSCRIIGSKIRSFFSFYKLKSRDNSWNFFHEMLRCCHIQNRQLGKFFKYFFLFFNFLYIVREVECVFDLGVTSWRTSQGFNSKQVCYQFLGGMKGFLGLCQIITMGSTWSRRLHRLRYMSPMTTNFQQACEKA